MEQVHLVNVTSENILAEGIFCLKNEKYPGFKKKLEWLEKRFKEGLQLLILKSWAGVQLGFIEFVPSEYSWRPVKSENSYFIHCLWVYPNKNQNKGYGNHLISGCIEAAKANKKDGVVVMTSDGPWMVKKELFLKHGFEQVDAKDRFELLVKKLNHSMPAPKFLDWEKNLKKYKGWNLIYADQCPMHQKSVEYLSEVAAAYNIKLQIRKINQHSEVKQAPSGYGVYSLVYDGKLMADHYISKTRFKNILEKALKH